MDLSLVLPGARLINPAHPLLHGLTGGLANQHPVKNHDLLKERLEQLLSVTHPEDDVVAEKEVLIPAADLGIRVSIIMHLPRGGICGQTWER